MSRQWNFPEEPLVFLLIGVPSAYPQGSFRGLNLLQLPCFHRTQACRSRATSTGHRTSQARPLAEPRPACPSVGMKGGSLTGARPPAGRDAEGPPGEKDMNKTFACCFILLWGAGGCSRSGSAEPGIPRGAANTAELRRVPAAGAQLDTAT